MDSIFNTLQNAGNIQGNSPAQSSVVKLLQNPGKTIQGANSIGRDVTRGVVNSGLDVLEAPQSVLDALRGTQTNSYQPMNIPGLPGLGPVQSHINQSQAYQEQGDSPITSLGKSLLGFAIDEPFGKVLGVGLHAIGFGLGAIKEFSHLTDALKEGDIAKAQDVLTQSENSSSKTRVPQAGEQGEKQSTVPKQSGLSSPQSTTPTTKNKVDLNVVGDNEKDRVASAIGNSEGLKTQIINKGQDAYLSGRDLSPSDLKLAEQYEHGTAVTDLASKAENPKSLDTFINKLADYYDFRLASDRAVGGSTKKITNYIPHSWDLSNPKDLEAFNELIKQKGLRPYNGFHAQPRVFKTYAEGEAAGFKRSNKNILEDLKSDYEVSSNSISKQALKQGLYEAAPSKVSLSGMGQTPEGRPFINSNAPGMEGMSFHPDIQKQLQGFEPLNHQDFINLVKKSGAETAITKSGLGGTLERTIASIKSIPTNAKEAGFSGTLGSIYDHISGPMKQILWNFSGFHSLNITFNHIGASTLHPITGAKGVLQSVGSALSEKLYKASVDSYKTNIINGKSVYDWAVDSGAFEARNLPAEGKSRLNIFAGGQRAIFDREIPILQLNLAEQAAKKGIDALSPAGREVGKEIRTITGEINSKTMNLNPNTMKTASRLFLAPGFTFSKYKTLADAFTKFGKTNGAAGELARTAVVGKSAILGVVASIGTLLATGKFPNLSQILTNFTTDPSIQTNVVNTKGQKQDVTLPKSFVSEGTGAFLDPTHYAEARLNPLLSDFIKIKTNKDYYNRPIVDANSTEPAWKQTVKNIGIGHLPIGAQSLANQALGKQTGTQSVIQIAGLRTRTSKDDPSVIKYKALDDAKTAISNISGSDPDRVSKMQTIFNSLPPADRKSLAYQELLAGIKTKGVYTSEVERKYFQVQDLVRQGNIPEAAKITQSMTPQEYKTYQTIKTRLAHEAVYQKVKDLVKAGNIKEATSLTENMTPQEYKTYQTWKLKNK